MTARKGLCNKASTLVASMVLMFAAGAGAEQPRKTLASDNDWRGKGEVVLAQGETIDLAGHRLSLSAIAGAGTVTDTVGGGVVYMEVPDGRSVVNTNVMFTGKLRFVKAGSGLYRQACMYQSYEGGTLVEAGTLCGRDRDLNIRDKMNWGRAGTEIRVERGATLDLRNSCNNCYWHIVLNGGCLRLKDYLAKPHEDAQIQRLTLLADSPPRWRLSQLVSPPRWRLSQLMVPPRWRLLPC